jgi:glycosyltransferase involved in cell wall biosynthesis
MDSQPISSHVVIAIGGFPPPVTGAAKNLQIICDDIKANDVNLVRCNIARGHLEKRWALLPLRLWRYSNVWFRLFRNAKFQRKAMYLTSDGGYGLALTFITVLIARILRYEILIQHRTYQYVRQKKFLANAVNYALGPKGMHIFLSEGMARQFFQNYTPQRKFLVNHNLAQFSLFGKDIRRIPRKRGKVLRVGYLSNLIQEKGFDTFLNVAQLAKNSGIQAQFIIAGPAPSEKERNLVMTAVEDMQGQLQWLGPVYGHDKMRFFRDIDIFMFPTRYYFEAQPNVVLEALCAGNYVIATDIGCIGEDISELNGTLVPITDARNYEIWLANLTSALNNKDLFKIRAQSLKTTHKNIARAHEGYSKLLNYLTWGAI